MVAAACRSGEARRRPEPPTGRREPKEAALFSAVCAVRFDHRDSKKPSAARACVATIDRAARRGCCTGPDLRRADRLDGGGLAGGPRGERLPGRQDRTYARPVGRGTGRRLSLLLVYPLSEFLRGLGIADRGESCVRKVLCCFEP